MKRKSKNADAQALSETYGISLAQAAKAVEDGAPKPAVEKTPDLATPVPTAEPVAQAAVNRPRLATSRDLAAERHESRDATEQLLMRLGLREPSDDGNSLYDVARLEQMLAEEDNTRIAAAAELTDAFASDSLVERAVQEALAEMKEKWLIDSGLHGELVALKQGMLAKLRKLHMYQQSQRAGDIWQELVAIENFERDLLAAIAARRPPKAEGDTKTS